MVSGQDVILRAIELLSERGHRSALEVPPSSRLAAGQGLRRSMTLFAAVRNSLGMNDADSLYSYWEWEDLELFLAQIWNALDESASEASGRKVSAVVFASEQSSLATVLDLLGRTETTALLGRTTIHPKPVTPNSLAIGSLTSSILTSTIVLSGVRQQPLAAVLTELLENPGSDRTILSIFDREIEKLIPGFEGVPSPALLGLVRFLVKAIDHCSDRLVSEELVASDQSLRYVLGRLDSELGLRTKNNVSIAESVIHYVPFSSDVDQKAVDRLMKALSDGT